MIAQRDSKTCGYEVKVGTGISEHTGIRFPTELESRARPFIESGGRVRLDVFKEGVWVRGPYMNGSPIEFAIFSDENVFPGITVRVVLEGEGSNRDSVASDLTEYVGHNYSP